MTPAASPAVSPELNAASLLPGLPHAARILIIRLRSIGDTILLTPALQLLKQWRPDLRLSVMVEARFREVLAGNPAVEEILTPGEGRGLAKLRSRLETIRALRAKRFSLCMNLHGGPTSRQLARWSGARWRVGFAHYRGPSLYHVLIPDARTILNKPALHTAEHQAAAFFYLGLPQRDIPRTQLFPHAEKIAWWAEKKRSFGLAPNRPYAIVHPTALYKTKEWAPENFARLGEYLEQHFGLTPVYSCGPGESRVLDAVEKAAGHAPRRFEGASLSQFMAAVAGARLFVGNDSGPAHMAAALGRPAVVIFGSSSSSIWGPWPPHAPDTRIVQNPYDCNPCAGDHCYRFPRPECILSVSFDQVRNAVDAVLAEAP